jgi:hypothetical protein
MAYQPCHAGEVAAIYCPPSLKDLVAFLKIKAGTPPTFYFPFALMKDNPIRSAPNQRHEFFNPTSVSNPLGEIIMNQEAHQ